MQRPETLSPRTPPTQPTRRQFLQNASVALAAPWLSPSIARSAFAQADSAHPQAAPQTLTGSWEFVRHPLAGPWEVWSDQPIFPWAAISLPHCYNSYDACDPDEPAYRGRAWYRRFLQVQNPFPAGRTLLHFEGAGQSAQVFLGETLAGGHIGGYDEWVLDITSLTQTPAAAGAKGIPLSVLCDNSPALDRMPADLSDFTLYGGLYRDVHLVYAPAVSLERVHIRVDAGQGRPARVVVEARLYNPGNLQTPLHLDVVVHDPGGTERHRFSRQFNPWKDSAELTSFELDHPVLWSPASPGLYRCEVTLTSTHGVCTQQERFGVRFFEFKEKGPFYLNGERLLIQGTHRHEDHSGYAAAMPKPLIREEMRLIKEMGANFIRLAHYQQQQLVLDLCDELGLLVWEEIPWCRSGVGSDSFQQLGRNTLTALIDQHLNHPAVVCWGLGNEDDWEGEYPSVDKTAIRAYMQELNALAHRLDPSRVTSFRRADFARDIPDVYSPSIWAGWYGGRYVDYEKSLTQQRDRNTRMLHVEWGADSHARRHAEDPYRTLGSIRDGGTAEVGLAYLAQGGDARVSRDGDWSETYACDLFDWHLKVQQSLPWLTGAVQWIFKDFTTPLRSENPVPRVNQKGVVERDLTRKESFYVFQSYWAKQPMVHIYGHTWPVRWGTPGQKRLVRVYSNCPAVEFFLNGVSLGVRRRNIQDFPCAGLRWDTPFRNGQNTLRAVAVPLAADPQSAATQAQGSSGMQAHASPTAGQVGGPAAIGQAAETTTTEQVTGPAPTDEVSFLYQAESWTKPAKLMLHLLDRNASTVRIEATLHDVQGNLCLDARNTVRFTLAGDGSLIDNLGTSTGSRVVQLYNGRASITIRTGKTKAVAGVASEGIETAILPL